MKTLVDFMRFSLGHRAPKEEQDMAFIKPDTDHVIQIADSTYLGSKELRPADMMRMELKSNKEKRNMFYRPNSTLAVDNQDSTKSSRKYKLPELQELN